MRIGIVVYSKTGNTLSAAKELRKELSNRGHDVSIERIETKGDPEKDPKIELKSAPLVEGYDALIFGSPVWAFRLCPVMSVYLKGIPSLAGRKVSLFVTKELSFKWLGGGVAISKMRKLVVDKGGKVVSSGIIVWKKKTGASSEMPRIVKDLADPL